MHIASDRIKNIVKQLPVAVRWIGWSGRQTIARKREIHTQNIAGSMHRTLESIDNDMWIRVIALESLFLTVHF